MANMGRCGQHGCAFSVRLVNRQRDEYCPECEVDTLRRALMEVLPVTCDDVHHSTGDRHGFDEPCPVLRRARKALGLAEAK